MEPVNDFHERHLRKDIEAVFTSITSVIKASLRPLPTETGDGTYVEEPLHSSLLEDISRLTFRDVATINDVLQDKIVSEPVDDRTYLQERTVAVRHSLHLHLH